MSNKSIEVNDTVKVSIDEYGDTITGIVKHISPDGRYLIGDTYCHKDLVTLISKSTDGGGKKEDGETAEEILKRHVERNLTGYSYDNIMSTDSFESKLCNAALDAMAEYNSQSALPVKKDERIDAVAFCQWANQLGGKTEYPRNENGSMMNYYELYHYWLNFKERDSRLKHASKYPEFSALPGLKEKLKEIRDEIFHSLKNELWSYKMELFKPLDNLISTLGEDK